ERLWGHCTRTPELVLDVWSLALSLGRSPESACCLPFWVSIRPLCSQGLAQERSRVSLSGWRYSVAGADRSTRPPGRPGFLARVRPSSTLRSNPRLLLAGAYARRSRARYVSALGS